MSHLITIDDLDRQGIERVLDQAESFAEVAGREIKKVPALRGRTVVNLFYEASTRTSSSFELAATRLSADVVTVRASGSSVEKGESLRDTVRTLSAYEPAAIVIRSPHAGAAQLVSQWTDAAVVNAGDGKHEHPTQALLDLFTLRKHTGELEGLNIWIVGDVLHSRVARSNIIAFQKLGAKVTVAGPPTLLPRGIEALGCAAEPTLNKLHEADVVYVLRMQNERMQESFIPSLGEYASRYQINHARLRPGQLVMHPGPVNRNVEISSDVVDSEIALIEDQVRSGVAVRMAVLYDVTAGTNANA
jgi:aspartate carbamoyltransferase catalytic subunit